MPPKLSSDTTIRRIHREIAGLKKEDLGPMSLAPSDDSLFLWEATLPGPEGSLYEGGMFEVEMRLASDYPFTAPKANFKTRIYHMNQISEQGNICIDILKHQWSPALSLFKLLLSLSSLLTDPNPKDPLVPSIANQYVRDRKQHDSTAREWTRLYARPKPPTISTPKQSLRVQGKRKAPDPGSSSQPPQAMARSNIPIRIEEPITIEDSDDETSRSSAKGKRRREADCSEILGVSDDGSDSIGRDRVGTSRKRRNTSQITEVIIIDDD
ncbi:ubiquitin-conjugating enzyme/RWD-like protein [Infundibulicybe gibba]|nr:ubiquitin-conjugating enzyme/RWD-like protein [Infundibulicybe gibba]